MERETSAPHHTENRTILGLFNKVRPPQRLAAHAAADRFYCTEEYHNLGAKAYGYISSCVDKFMNDLARNPRVDSHPLRQMAAELRDTNVPAMENAFLRFQETVSELEQMPVHILDSDTSMRDEWTTKLFLNDMDCMGENYNNLVKLTASSAALDMVLAEIDHELEMTERLLTFMETTVIPEEITEEDLKKLVACFRQCSEIDMHIKKLT